MTTQTAEVFDTDEYGLTRDPASADARLEIIDARAVLEVERHKTLLLRQELARQQGLTKALEELRKTVTDAELKAQFEVGDFQPLLPDKERSTVEAKRGAP